MSGVAGSVTRGAHPLYGAVRSHGLGDVLREHRRSRPLMAAVVDGEHRSTWPQLDARVNRLAGVLRECGVGSGGRLMWLGQNSFRVLECLLAAAKVGAVLCPANWRMGATEMAHAIQDFDPQVVVWQDLEIGDTVRRARTLHAGTAHWIQHDATGTGSYEHFIAMQSDADDDLRVDADAPVLAIFTAAFDGRPKAALLSHAAILAQALVSGYGFAIDERSVYLNAGPLFHLGTLNTTLTTFVYGGCNVFVRRAEAEEMLQAIQDERVSHAFVPQPTIERMRELNTGGAWDVSSLWSTPDAREYRHPQVMPAAAPFAKRLGVYGQTETTGWAVVGWLGHGEGSRPSPMVQVRIVDDDGREVAAGETGEIVVRGALVMCGYAGADAENAARAGDGWHHTRDLGRRLADGSIEFVGPKTVLIKSALENVYPAEVERCLREHPAVRDACVIGVPDERWTQSVKAVVVAAPGDSVTADDLIAHCRERIASYKKPKSVVFVDALPALPGGGVDRAAVDAAHGGGGYPQSRPVPQGKQG